MIQDLKSYPAYKGSGVSWLGKVPEHWDVPRIRSLVHLIVSNVDKHTVEGQLTVRLCNYIDVYKNDRITERLRYMQASATQEEIRRFCLKVGDVLITKDSEMWNDIAVPALVEYEASDFVCGYHLAIIRPRSQSLASGFLFWCLQSPGVAAQFHIVANGVTRYGLSYDAIKDVRIPVPSVCEQSAIIRFLDYMDRRIRRYIRAKQRLIKLLEEQKQAIIHRAVTRGLDPSVRLKPSGVEWLGDMPEHWEMRPAKRFYREVDDRSVSGSEELLSVSHLTGVTPRSQKTVTMFKAESYVGHKLCRPGDLVINTMWAWMGAIGVAYEAGIVSPSYAVYRPLKASTLLPRFADALLRTPPYIAEYRRRSTGVRSSRLRLYPEQFLTIPLICPPHAEQEAILRHLATASEGLEHALLGVQRELAVIREYRTCLVADVVTGKLDVREAAANVLDQPEEAEDFEEGEEQATDDEGTEEAQLEAIEVEA